MAQRMGGDRAKDRSKDDRRVFEQAMQDVVRLGEEGRPRTIASRKRRVQRSLGEVGEPLRFHVEQWGEPPNEHWEAVAPEVGRQPIQRLRRGQVALERTLDLHGLDAPAARERVSETLRQMWERGERGLLIIHGRGLHSEDAPVLKESLPGWLAAPPHGRRILAFMTAPPDLGGTGATLVLLRKRRR